MKKIVLYCDGACSGNPGPGGWGSLLIFGDKQKELSGFEPETTNNRMELLAPIQGLAILKEQCEVDIYTDSAYVYNAFEKGWLNGWQKNGWKTSKREPVLNQDLWKKLLQMVSTHKVHWHKVKGHSDNEGNNRCDELARSAIRNRGGVQ